MESSERKSTPVDVSPAVESLPASDVGTYSPLSFTMSSPANTIYTDQIQAESGADNG
jgi:hypothetical protein